MGISVDCIVSVEDSVDITRVKAKKDTAKGGEGAHNIGLDCDGSLDKASVGRGHDRSAATHIETCRWTVNE